MLLNSGDTVRALATHGSVTHNCTYRVLQRLYDCVLINARGRAIYAPLWLFGLALPALEPKPTLTLGTRRSFNESRVSAASQRSPGLSLKRAS